LLGFHACDGSGLGRHTHLLEHDGAYPDLIKMAPLGIVPRDQRDPGYGRYIPIRCRTDRGEIPKKSPRESLPEGWFAPKDLGRFRIQCACIDGGPLYSI
jgi:hypothetical protein